MNNNGVMRSQRVCVVLNYRMGTDVRWFNADVRLTTPEIGTAGTVYLAHKERLYRANVTRRTGERAWHGHLFVTEVA